MKQCRKHSLMVCQWHMLLRRRRWIAEGVGSEVNSRVQPSPRISRPCTARVCLLPSVKEGAKFYFDGTEDTKLVFLGKIIRYK